MQIKVANNDPQSMSQDGDSILKSLQNKSLPLIDLMVRESLQNSLDATIENSSTTMVDFVVGEFQSTKLALHFEKISDKLQSDYGGQQQFISVSDKNTTGLTGDFRSDNHKILDKSNFQKLVFGIGKNQDRDGAGGSWGLGKTSYFRMGIGIVIYYTRIRVDSGYEERLIASLIESPKQNNILLPTSERGIAWWGELDNNSGKVFPLTNHDDISNILDIFGLKPYFKEETGTTIIIPYVHGIDTEGKDDGIGVFPWEFSYVDSIKMAIQRWYNPRIWNEDYSKKTGNSMLKCSVNGTGIVPMSSMEPVFLLFRELYSTALNGETQNKRIQVEPIILPRNAMKNNSDPVGHIAFCQVSREEMGMVPPDNKPSALSYLGVKSLNIIEKNTSKVIAYSRKPGMVVEYSIDGDWSPKGQIQKDDHLLLGFFVPNSSGMLLEKYQKMGYPTLESYLRAAENADHAEWKDEDKVGIIRRMKSYSAKVISEAFQDNSNIEHSLATSALSRKFGRLLMPPKNFGKTSTYVGNNSGGKKTGNKKRMSDITILSSMPIDDKSVAIEFKAFLKNRSASTISVQVLTQDGKMDVRLWQKTMGETVKFPFSIQSVFLSKVDEEEVNVFAIDYKDQEIAFNLQTDKEEQFSIISKVKNSVTVEGTIYLQVDSNQYLPTIVIRSEVSKEGGEE